MGGVYFAVGYGAFNLLTHSRSISGGSTFWVLLWMSVSYGFTNFSWLWLRLSRDRHLAEWSMLILVWWFCCPLMSQIVYGPVRVRHAADCHPTHDGRVPRVDGRHPVAQAYGRSCGVPPIGMDTCRSGSGVVEDIRNT